MEVIKLKPFNKSKMNTIKLIPQSQIYFSVVKIFSLFIIFTIGIQKTIVSCGKCTYKSVTYNPFMALSLAYESTLVKCLTTYLKEDTLDSSDKYKCEKCNSSTKAKIRSEISKLPQYLIFHFKRFTFPQMKKIKGKIKYSSYIDMKK